MLFTGSRTLTRMNRNTFDKHIIEFLPVRSGRIEPLQFISDAELREASQGVDTLARFDNRDLIPTLKSKCKAERNWSF